MTQQTLDHGLGDDVLVHVREGMEVYDVTNKKVGKVEYVYLGEASPKELELGEGPATPSKVKDIDHSLVEDIARAFSPDDDLPEELHQRLVLEGFIRVDGAGLFAADRYVLADQIAVVSGDHVRLKVSRAQLI